MIYEMKKSKCTVCQNLVPPAGVIALANKLADIEREYYKDCFDKYMINGVFVVPEENIPKDKKKK
jgi:hypothetical protein